MVDPLADGEAAPVRVMLRDEATLEEILRFAAIGPTSRRVPPGAYRVTVSPDRLDAQLGWLRRRGLRGVGMAELLAARARGEGRDLVGLTFDSISFTHAPIA